MVILLFYHNRRINDNLESSIQTIFNEYFPDCNDSSDDTLGNHIECILGGTPSRENEAFWHGNIAWINSGKVNDFRITTPSDLITQDAIKKSATKLMPKHTVVLAITGATLGQESILLIDSCANQSVVGLLENAILPYEFLHPFIKRSMSELLRNQTGGAQPHINKDDVKNIPICVPTEECISNYQKLVKSFFEKIEHNCFEIDMLSNLLEKTLAILSR